MNKITADQAVRSARFGLTQANSPIGNSFKSPGSKATDLSFNQSQLKDSEKKQKEAQARLDEIQRASTNLALTPSTG